jgi:deaminated glutathione amidase
MIVRLAAAQYATGCDVDENLDTALRMIDEAARAEPTVLVLPEFGNHLSIYDSAEHCWEVAIDLDSAWTERIGALAERHSMWIQFNCTVRRESGRVTNTNLLVDPAGRLAAANDKTVLMGAEGIFLSPANQPAEVIDAGFARLGTYACMDGVVPEVPRTLAVRGANILLNSLNSFALDEASTHIPVRAAENRAWLVACCKIGPLLPPDRLTEFAQNMGVPPEMLRGAGESQIVRPDGVVVAQGPRDDEAVIVADADLSLCGRPRPDGTDLRRNRRPSVYAALAQPTPAADDHRRADRIQASATSDIREIESLVRSGSTLVVLPELALDDVPIESIASVLAGTDALVVSSRRHSSPRGSSHCGVAIDSSGIVLHQSQIHRVARHPWVDLLGDSVVTLEAPFGRLAIVVGDDVLYPEIPRLAALAAVDVIAVPWAAGGEAWDVELCLPERAAENRVNLVAAGPENVVISLPADFTLWAPERRRPFDGTINLPDIARARGTVTSDVHPSRSLNRRISRNTDLVDGRPWQLCESLTV